MHKVQHLCLRKHIPHTAEATLKTKSVQTNILAQIQKLLKIIRGANRCQSVIRALGSPVDQTNHYKNTINLNWKKKIVLYNLRVHVHARSAVNKRRLMCAVCLILHEQRVTGILFLDLRRDFQTCNAVIVSHNVHGAFVLRCYEYAVWSGVSGRVNVLSVMLRTDAWNKLGAFPNLLNCPCHNSSGISFFNIQCCTGAGYKSSVIGLAE